MLARLREQVSRFAPRSASVRNVLKLAGGTAGAQVITVASAPILTRLYGPESFGVLATFTSILALLNVVSSLRYELAIAVPEDDDEAIALVWLCFGLVGFSTLLTALGVGLLGDTLVHWLHQPQLKPLLWLLPVGVLLTGLYQPLSYWAVRRKQFGLLAKTKFRQSIFGIGASLMTAPLGAVGLLLGQIVSQSAGFIAILWQSFKLLLKSSGASPRSWLPALRCYSHFGIYSSPAGLINIIGSQVPNLVLASFFGVELLGQFSLAQRLLWLPGGLVGTSISQVFLSQASSYYRSGNLLELIKRISKKLTLVGLLTSIIASLIGLFLMQPIFGEKWIVSGQLIPLLIPAFLGQLVVSTLSMGFLVVGGNKIELASQTLQAITRLVFLIVAALLSSNFQIVIFSFSLGTFIGYGLYGGNLLLLLRSKQVPPPTT